MQHDIYFQTQQVQDSRNTAELKWFLAGGFDIFTQSMLNSYSSFNRQNSVSALQLCAPDNFYLNSLGHIADTHWGASYKSLIFPH